MQKVTIRRNTESDGKNTGGENDDYDEKDKGTWTHNCTNGSAY